MLDMQCSISFMWSLEILCLVFSMSIVSGRGMFVNSEVTSKLTRMWCSGIGCDLRISMKCVEFRT